MAEAAKKEETFEPPKRTFTIEFFVGLFTILGVVCFGYLAINLAGIRLNDSAYYKIRAEFDNVSGLKVGAPVEIAGVPVGAVSGIELSEVAALVTMEVENAVQIRDDDIAAVRTKGIIGDKYVKIIPGGSEDFLANGGRLTDTEPVVDFEEIIGKFIHKME